MQLTSRPRQDDEAEDTNHGDAGFTAKGRVTQGSDAPDIAKGARGVSFTFGVERGNGYTDYEATLTHKELLELVAIAFR